MKKIWTYIKESNLSVFAEGFMSAIHFFYGFFYVFIIFCCFIFYPFVPRRKGDLWFAWYPVRVNHDEKWVWFSWVVEQKYLYGGNWYVTP